MVGQQLHSFPIMLAVDKTVRPGGALHVLSPAANQDFPVSKMFRDVPPSAQLVQLLRDERHKPQTVVSQGDMIN